ncbi:UDP-2,4-diacetamido-2,4,6-trideoxy-beta-L-altropyranose hydrolase [Pistricoccus aurantiacus]|uniref:UDP-2,4-diacetamido-2,4, 6-trideoxy-beta-L-altropyranose hydrolase n=1 Tax=Pistricoccus aurantiacus TaxID=1883414 RepID=A0A5B8SUS6_9GAMM|nr:UDP-2,4-diacetamido-2,4,6-trideoxy-beta-L-altropyranose hydrolase [Pistricoccus aurantiacus]QEA40064.1 UDP-2,4-diacetamido-2,4,6-trideoxy-beta-L-altropyranose hydrolase [Pistricoccus aurantiacus]
MTISSGSQVLIVAFRVDASLTIGTGHVMRCLTLADALRERGAECHFLCREHPGHLIEAIRSRGFQVDTLPMSPESMAPEEVSPLAHAAWLGASWQEDARQSRAILEGLAPDWLVVDHYALDRRWEETVLPPGCRLLVIDDLADREHGCDVLLDQNLGRQAEDYVGLVSEHCTRLIGPHYALLRPEFARLRETSLDRRATPRLKQLLITMGGIDKDNATGAVLDALRQFQLPQDCRISVVMGGNAPWLAQVKDQAAMMPWPTEVAVNVTDMAERMARADLAIGAAGSTSWERCCLGLPTLVVVLAENQWNGAKALSATGAAILVGEVADISTRLPPVLRKSASPASLAMLDQATSAVTDGRGSDHVVEAMVLLTQDGANDG